MRAEAEREHGVDTRRGAAAGEGPPAPDGLEPAWLRALALVAAIAVVAFGGAGLVLAVAGVYRPALAYALGGLCTGALLLLARPVLRARGRDDRAAHAVALAGVVLVVAIGAWNVANRSEHVLINRDPGVYANAGRWLASNGDLRVTPAPRAVTEIEGVTQHSFGVYLADGGNLELQFAHLLPVLLAEAHRVGGDSLMFAVPAILGAAALLAFFLVLWRVTRVPWIALVGTAALGLTLPQVAFSRDTYSEIPTQLLAFTVVWLLLVPAAARSARTMLLAGVLAGALQMVRIDALILLVGLPLAFAVFFVTAEPAARRRIVRGAVAFAGGASIGLAVGLVDLVLRSGDYYRDLSGEVRSLLVATVGAVVVAVAFAVVGPRIRLPRSLRGDLVGRAAAVLVVLTGVFAWFVRPRVEEIHGAASPYIEGLQRAEGVAPDATLRYYDHSFDWMAWYHGRVGVALAILGAALVARRLFTGRAAYFVAPVAVLGPASALYLWRAKAFQDHLWVMRRFLIGAMPLFVILGAFALAWLTRRGTAGRIVAIVGAALVVLHPMWTLRDVPRATEQPGYTRAIEEACHAFGPRAAAIVVAGDDLVHEWIPQALRGWCDTEVAIVRGAADRDLLDEVRDAWEGDDRRVWLVAGETETLLEAVPDATVTATRVIVNDRQLERTLTRRPDRYVEASFAFVFAPLEAPG